MSNHAKPLSDTEWKCLESISRLQGIASPAERAGVAYGRDCSESSLHQLAVKGFIELVPEIWLPLEMKRSVYRLTTAGKVTLADRQKGRGPEDV